MRERTRVRRLSQVKVELSIPCCKLYVYEEKIAAQHENQKDGSRSNFYW